MKRLIVGIVLLVALALPMRALAQDRDEPLVVGQGQHVTGSIATVGQDIQIDGAVEGDVTSWEGDITVAGYVGGDVVSYAGHVTIAATGRVDGHVLVLGSQLQPDQQKLVGGQIIEGGVGANAVASVLGILMPTSNAVPGDSPVGRGLFGAVLGVLSLAFCMLCIAFWPRRTAAASQTLLRFPGRALLLGLTTTLALALALLPLIALLAATVIGIPLIVVLLLLVEVSYLYGLATLARAIGGRLGGQRGQATEFSEVTVGGALALVLLIAVVGAAAPLWGVALFHLVASPGLGAAILSRGGLLVPVAARG